MQPLAFAGTDAEARTSAAAVSTIRAFTMRSPGGYEDSASLTAAARRGSLFGRRHDVCDLVIGWIDDQNLVLRHRVAIRSHGRNIARRLARQRIGAHAGRDFRSDCSVEVRGRVLAGRMLADVLP